MNDSLIWVIVACAGINYLIRVTPFLLARLGKPPKIIQTFLGIMPTAALGALIFPAVLEFIPQHPEAGIIGLIVAVLIAWFTKNLIVPVLGCVGSIWLYLSLKTLIYS